MLRMLRGLRHLYLAGMRVSVYGTTIDAPLYRLKTLVIESVHSHLAEQDGDPIRTLISPLSSARNHLVGIAMYNGPPIDRSIFLGKAWIAPPPADGGPPRLIAFVEPNPNAKAEKFRLEQREPKREQLNMRPFLDQWRAVFGAEVELPPLLYPDSSSNKFAGAGYGALVSTRSLAPKLAEVLYRLGVSSKITAHVMIQALGGRYNSHYTLYPYEEITVSNLQKVCELKK
jgi:hypothetical protein